MADQGDEDRRPEGAEGGESSSEQDVEYELVAEEEEVDTSWESGGALYPIPEQTPRVGFGSSGMHPNVPPPRIYLTNRPARASPSKGVQTDSPQQSQPVEQEGPQQARPMEQAGPQLEQPVEQEGPQQARPMEQEGPRQEQGGQADAAQGQQRPSLRQRLSRGWRRLTKRK